MPDRPDRVLPVSSLNKGVLIGLAAGFDLFMVIVVGVVLGQQMAGGVAVSIVIAVFVIGLDWLLWRVATQSIRVRGDEVALRRTLSTRRVPRSRIVGADFFLFDTTMADGTRSRIPRLILDDGDAIAVPQLAAKSESGVAARLTELRRFLGLPDEDPRPAGEAVDRS